MVRAGIGGSGGSVLVCGARSVGRTQLVAQRSWLPQSFFNNARPIPHWHDARMRAGSGDSMLLDASPSFWACQKFHRSPESPHPPRLAMRQPTRVFDGPCGEHLQQCSASHGVGSATSRLEGKGNRAHTFRSKAKGSGIHNTSARACIYTPSTIPVS